MPEPFEMKLAKAQVIKMSTRQRIGWEQVKMAVRAYHASHNMTYAELAKRIGVSKGTLSVYLSHSPQADDRRGSTAEKIRDWIVEREPRLRQTLASTAKGAPKSQAVRVAGPARFRDKSDRNPAIIGGRPPPLGNIARRRSFGLHSMLE